MAENTSALKDFPTSALVEELKTREGVETHDVPFERGYSLEIDCDGWHEGDGPAIILIVTD